MSFLDQFRKFLDILMSGPTPHKIRIAVNLDLRLGFHAQIGRGLNRFRNTRPHWEFIESEWEHLPTIPFRIDGLLGHILPRDKDLPYLREQRCSHQISITNLHPGPVPWKRVINDDRAIGEMAADYFLRKRFTRFGVWELSDLQFSRERAGGFCARLQDKGIDQVHRFTQEERFHFERLRTLFPIALFVVSDITAKSLMGYLEHAQIQVPHEVALLGVDNDPQIELFTSVPLSSIQTDGEGIGFRACEVLEDLIAGRPVNPVPETFAPLGIEERFSTETMAVEDPLIRKVQSYLEENLAAIPDMTAVAKALHLHRRHLDRRFITAVGVSPTDWLARRRVARAEKLLLETNDTIDLIAERVGLRDRRRLNLTFRKFSRPQPSLLRKRH